MDRQPPTYESEHTRTWVLTTAAESDGELFEQRVEYRPESPFPPLHLHPQQSERFVVEQGAMVYIVEAEARRVEAGETLELPAGTRHKARNASTAEPAVIRWETRPALRSEAFFATAAAMGQSGPLEQALLAHEYRDVFKVTGFQGVLIPLVAALARLMGRNLPQ